MTQMEAAVMVLACDAVISPELPEGAASVILDEMLATKSRDGPGFPQRTRGVSHSMERIDGLLVLDKPIGLTSRAALDRALKWFPRGTRMGHTGTLDPLA